MNILAIGAHPDDIEIGAGASIGIHRKMGDTVRFVILTRGGKISDPSKRTEEARTAADILNVSDVHFLDYEDTRVPYDHEIIEALGSHVREINPDRVYIHAKDDTHQDHRHAAMASITASRDVAEVLAFEAPSTRPSFSPRYYNPVPGDLLNRKIEAIQSHESQKEKKYLEAEAMEGLARFRGRQSNARYAEAFQVVRLKNGYGTEL